MFNNNHGYEYLERDFPVPTQYRCFGTIVPILWYWSTNSRKLQYHSIGTDTATEWICYENYTSK
ncbi:MAG: hypothetical protein IKU79_01120 [Bacteroidaceae bacterium]|jgi:hypothetical protein|nr:hypothetical protein [Bacteroidaceae bacterium]